MNALLLELEWKFTELVPGMDLWTKLEGMRTSYTIIYLYSNS